MPSAGHLPPASWYCEGDPFQHERRTLFARSWLMLGRAGALERPGDYFAVNLAGWPLVALRGDDHVIRVFRNTCRHQSMPVVDQPAGHVHPDLRCRYHGWTYDTRGRFADAPAQYAPVDRVSAANDLAEIELADWRELLFGRVSPAGTAFEPMVSGADWPFGASQALSFASEMTTEFGCNWKVLIEHIVGTAEARSGRDRSVRWHWPTLVMESAPGEWIVHQIVPRTFSRTRVVTYFFFSSTANEAPRIAEVKAELEADRAQCEKVQTELQAGAPVAPAPAGSAIDRFRHAVAAAHASAPATDPLAGKSAAAAT